MIRRAVIDDIDTIREIARNTYKEHFSSIWSQEGMEQFLARDFSHEVLNGSLLSSSHLWLLCEDPGGTVVGYAKVNWNQPDPIFGMVGAELQKIYFTAAATGKSYGSELIQHIASAASLRCQPMLWLNVLASNHGGQRFYARSGFEVTGQIPFSTDIADLEMLVMVRRLVANNSFKPKPLRGSA